MPRKEYNQAEDILNCIRQYGPIAAEDVAEKTGWNRHWVDVAAPMLIDAGLIEIAGKAPWGEPTYQAVAPTAHTRAHEED